MFRETSVPGAMKMKAILQEYECGFGQCVNFHKSIIFYNSNTKQVMQQTASNILGVLILTNPEKYLGLPNMVGRGRKNLSKI